MLSFRKKVLESEEREIDLKINKKGLILKTLYYPNKINDKEDNIKFLEARLMAIKIE